MCASAQDVGDQYVVAEYRLTEVSGHSFASLQTASNVIYRVSL